MAKDNPHFSKAEGLDQDENLVVIDYAFLRSREDRKQLPVDPRADDDDASSEEEAGNVGDKAMPVLVLRDYRHKYITANVVPRKGLHPYAIRRLGQDVSEVLGYNRVHIKSDQ